MVQTFMPYIAFLGQPLPLPSTPTNTQKYKRCKHQSILTVLYLITINTENKELKVAIRLIHHTTATSSESSKHQFIPISDPQSAEIPREKKTKQKSQ
jgi:hypothetical protein